MQHYIPYSPWTELGQHGRRVGDSIGGAMFQIPYVRSQEQQRREKLRMDAMELALRTSQIDSLNKLHGAETGLATQKTADLKRKAVSVEDLQAAFGELAYGISKNRVEPEQWRKFGSAMAGQEDENLYNMARAFTQMFATSGSELVGNPDRNLSLAGGNPQQLRTIIPDESVSILLDNPSDRIRGDFTLGPGQRRFSGEVPSTNIGGYKLDTGGLLGQQAIASVPPSVRSSSGVGNVPSSVATTIINSFLENAEAGKELEALNTAWKSMTGTNLVPTGPSKSVTTLKVERAEQLARRIKNYPQLTPKQKQQIKDQVNREMGP